MYSTLVDQLVEKFGVKQIGLINTVIANEINNKRS